MDELVLIGIGTGNTDHVTREGENALKHADAILIPRKGASKADLADLRVQICNSILGSGDKIVPFDMPVRDAEGDYKDGVERWHDEIALAWEKSVSAAGNPKRVALLVWGDPSLYDSSLRIAKRLRGNPKVSVVPGITALQALTAAHAIPLNTVGDPFIVTTGRQLREEGWPKNCETVAVMLDGECSFQTLEDPQTQIWWGAYLGMANQLLVSGRLTEVSKEIVEKRAQARRAHGWIMDIYLLRKD